MKIRGKDLTILARPASVNVAYMVSRTRVLGPGERFVIWVQGCPLRCPGCMNPSFLPFRKAAWVSVERLAGMIGAVRGIEGVTYAGGEPFAQSQALAALSRRVRASGLSVMAYSGYTLAELESEVLPWARGLLREIDLLLDGPYVRSLPTERPWRGSDNQRLVALSDRYRRCVEEWNLPRGKQFEVRFTGSGEAIVIGVPPAQLLLAEPGSDSHGRSIGNGGFHCLRRGEPGTRG